MDISQQNLSLVFKAFKTLFEKGFENTPSFYQDIAMTVPSSAYEEVYGWLGAFPGMREWIGDRIIHRLGKHDFSIKNRKFESTVDVERDKIADDQVGIYKPMFAEMGRLAKQHPDELIFALLAAGFDAICYDGQNFFDSDHPVGMDESQTTLVSNMQAGNEPSWFLLDTSRAVKPFVWQLREDYKFQTVNSDADTQVFLTDMYLYGIRARANAGYGLWQLAFGSKAELNDSNYTSARQSMMSQKHDNGRVLGIVPTTLVVAPALERKARQILKSNQIDGTSNVWMDSAELIVSPYLA